MRTFTIENEKELDALGKSGAVFENGCVLALGFFDGVHKAHRALIGSAGAEAKRLGIPLAVFTFSAESTSLKPQSLRLFTDKEKESELTALGIDATLIFSFELIKNITAEDFIEEILVKKLNTHTAFCGFNFRFGKNASGNTELLFEKMKSLGKSTVIVPEIKEKDGEISSSAIREMLSSKKLDEATRLLGKPFFANGKVLHGLGLGKKLGFPTVNLEFTSEKFTLPAGVYFTAVKIDDRLYPSVTNFGVCPTFDEREIHAETFIFDFDKDIYGEEIRLYFIEFIRDEIKFSSKNDLIMQINIDINKALQLAKETKWLEIGLS